MQEKQVKTKTRVSMFGEVYTAKREVNAMLDMVGETISDISKTVFEPACGNGSFLSEVLRRRIEHIKSNSYSFEQIDQAVLSSVASIYGVDIQKDNVVECRARLYQLVINTISVSSTVQDLLTVILKKNIIDGDTLTMKRTNGKPIYISEWEIRDNGVLICKDVLYSDMIANGGESESYEHRYYYHWKNVSEWITA